MYTSSINVIKIDNKLDKKKINDYIINDDYIQNNKNNKFNDNTNKIINKYLNNTTDINFNVKYNKNNKFTPKINRFDSSINSITSPINSITSPVNSITSPVNSVFNKNSYNYLNNVTSKPIVSNLPFKNKFQLNGGDSQKLPKPHVKINTYEINDTLISKPNIKNNNSPLIKKKPTILKQQDINHFFKTKPYFKNKYKKWIKKKINSNIYIRLPNTEKIIKVLGSYKNFVQIFHNTDNILKVARLLNYKKTINIKFKN